MIAQSANNKTKKASTEGLEWVAQHGAIKYSAVAISAARDIESG